MKYASVCLGIILSLALSASSEVLTIDDAITIALSKSSRGEIIKGNLEVAEKQYFAKKINFYVPKVFLNGSLPSYSVNESFRFFGGATQKSLYKTTDFEFRSNIQLDQSLITGGNLKVTANLNRSDSKYPNTSLTGTALEISELSRQGYFDFSFTQPILQPSTAKYELNNKRDDLEIARINNLEEVSSLKQDVIESYIGVLEMELQKEIAAAKLESAKLNAAIDSLKQIDEVISADKWLETASSHLDAELAKFDTYNQFDAQERSLKALLDFDDNRKLETEIPVVPQMLSDKKKDFFVNNWEESTPLKKAKYVYDKDQREAEFQSGSHGLTGNLTANYSLGRGTVEIDESPNDNIKTNSWGLSLNLTYPLWDGGASKASVNATEIASEKARLEYESVRKSVKADLADLVNRIDVSHKKLEILEKQSELAENKLNIAKYRYEDGQISKVQYNDNYIFYLEVRIKYLNELKKNLIDRAQLESKYIG